MNFYIADTHFGHANVIKFDKRPFQTVDEMDFEMVKRWNDVVSSGDTVYILGDMFWHNASIALLLIQSLKGDKVLIQGNHDKVRDAKLAKEFQTITSYMEIKDGNSDVVLCHYPIPCFKNHYYGWKHLYGHVHNGFEWEMMEQIRKDMKEKHSFPCNMYNVGSMLPYMDYTPRTLEEIITGYERMCENG